MVVGGVEMEIINNPYHIIKEGRIYNKGAEKNTTRSIRTAWERITLDIAMICLIHKMTRRDAGDYGLNRKKYL